MPAKKKKPRLFPQTSLLDIHQALTVANATVETAVQALTCMEEENAHVALMLEQNVSRPLNIQCGRIEMVVAHLVKPKRGKKRKPDGSRKGKKRQRNRWKERQEAANRWER